MFFKCTDWLCFLLGIKHYTSNCCIRRLNIVLRIIYILELTYALGSVLYLYFFQSHDSVVSDLGYIYLYCSTLFGYIYYVRNLQDIARLFTELRSYLNLINQIRCNRISLGLLLVLFVNVVFHTLTQVLYFMGKTATQVIESNSHVRLSDDTKVTIYHRLLAGYMLAVYIKCIPTFQTITCVMYAYAIYLFHLVEKQFYETAWLQFRHNSPNQLVTQKYVIQYVTITKLQANFNQYFELYPFLWLSYLFMKASAALVFMFSSSTNTQLFFLLNEYIGLITYLLTFAATIVVVSHQLEKTIEAKRNFVSNCYGLGIVNETKFLIEILARNEFVLTGWSMFVINKHLILSFSGSLITFSVLFANLSGAPVQA